MFVVRADPNYAQPWQMRPQRSGTGSAFITDVEKRRIMTNAHVVRRATPTASHACSVSHARDVSQGWARVRAICVVRAVVMRQLSTSGLPQHGYPMQCKWVVCIVALGKGLSEKHPEVLRWTARACTVASLSPQRVTRWWCCSPRENYNVCRASQTSNANTVHVRRPGNPKKWKARVLCEAKVSCTMDFMCEQRVRTPFTGVSLSLLPQAQPHPCPEPNHVGHALQPRHIPKLTGGKVHGSNACIRRYAT